MQTIKRILADAGEECEIDVDVLHETLSKLPAEMYLELYYRMQKKVTGYSPFYHSCCAPMEVGKEEGRSSV